MRSFKSFVNRRKIKDLAAWLTKNEIKSAEALARFCEVQEIRIDIEKYVHFFEPESQDAQHPATKEETWHVPAAERPIKSRKKAATPRKPTQKRTRSTTKKNKKD